MMYSFSSSLIYTTKNMLIIYSKICNINKLMNFLPQARINMVQFKDMQKKRTVICTPKTNKKYSNLEGIDKVLKCSNVLKSLFSTQSGRQVKY